MKNILLVILLILSFNPIYCQEKTNAKLIIQSCESIRTGIIDKNLYDTLNNGKLIFRPDLNKYKVYKITNDKNESYYVSKSVMKAIKRYMKKNDCKNIIIEKLAKKL